MSQKKQSGFSAVEVIIAVLVIVILGFIGWRLYATYYGKQGSITSSNSQNLKPKIGNSNSQTATPINPYTGWETYCSTSGGLCLHYPSSWKEQDTFSPATDTTAADIATITSPSGKLKVVYDPDMVGFGGGCPDNTCFFTTRSIDQTYTPNTVGLKVYNGVWTNSSSIVPMYFVSSDQQMSYYNLQLNQKKETHAFFTVFKSPIDNTSIENISVEDIPSKSYPSTADAEAWFNQPETATAGQILNSVYVNPGAKPASWLTYTSQLGNFTLDYPSTWTIDTTIGDPVYGKGSVIRLTHNSSVGGFGMDLDILSNPGTGSPYNTYGNGTIEQLANGITLWQEKQNINYATGPATVTCPHIAIGIDNTYSMRLNNGKYLMVNGGSYCWHQGETTNASYQDQISSQDWKDAISILSSIKFN